MPDPIKGSRITSPLLKSLMNHVGSSKQSPKMPTKYLLTTGVVIFILGLVITATYLGTSGSNHVSPYPHVETALGSVGLYMSLAGMGIVWYLLLSPMIRVRRKRGQGLEK